MTIEDYEEVYELWKITSNEALSSADERDPIGRYLTRNEGSSLVAIEEGIIVGTVLCGHDGRRGYIHHMAVLPEYRRRGIAKALADEALKRLREQGIEKVHIFVFTDNHTAQAAWSSMGWQKRDEILVYSFSLKK
jgi:ribosomal protein S18 acetylase RimI-like enzyme